MSKKKKVSIIILLLLLLVGIFIFWGTKSNVDNDNSNPISLLIPDKDAEKWNGKQELPQSGSSEEVAIPGIKSLVCYAGQTKQKVNLYNPEENSALLRMSIYADNQELWKSGYIEPGNGYYNIDLKKKLDIGVYDGTLLVECFLEDGTVCNQAKVKFDLIVEEKQK